jgi:hypothetical protein
MILFISIQTACAEDPEVKPFYEMTNNEIDALIREVSAANLTVTERMNLYSERFLGTDYNLKCAGDGPYALLEPWPLVNFQETNCMLFCEHVLALSISDTWDHFFNNLQEIRYKDGVIGMKTRNHYTVADWLPANRWLLDDVCEEVAGDQVQTVTRIISHKTFFAGKGITDTSYVLPDREMTIPYVPLAILDEVEERTRTGDVLALLFRNKENIFSAHMLMIAEKDGKKMIRESSSSKMTTFDTPYREWAKDVQENRAKRYLGLSFMRIRDELNTPGKIILPWDVSEMRSSQ